MAEQTDILGRLASLESAVSEILNILKRDGSPAGQCGQEAANFSSDDWQGLASKLDRFEDTLSPKEKAVMMTIIGAAAATYERSGLRESPAVEGRNTVKISGDISRFKLSDGLSSIGTFKPSTVGGFGDPASPVSDSVGVGGDFTSIHGDWTKELKLGDLMVRGRWNALALGGGPAQGGGLSGNFGRSGPTGGGFR